MNQLLLALVLLTSTLFFLALFKSIFQRKDDARKRIELLFNEQQQELQVTEKEVRTWMEFRLAKRTIRKNLNKRNKGEKIELELKQAGILLKPEEFVMFRWISIFLSAGILYLIFDHFIFILIGVIIGAYIPRFIIVRKKKQRLQRFNDYLAEMISSIIGALKAGFSFPQALQNVRNEAPSPVKEELDELLKEMQYGATAEEALNRMKERVPSDDLDLMIQAIIIQRQVGGNLAIVLEKIVHTIRERIKIQGQIKTLTAQGRLSGVVVGALPFGLGALLYVVNPEYISVLFHHPVGIFLLIIAGISMILGFIFIRKVTAIEV